MLTTVGGLLGNIDIVISNKVVFPILLLALLSIFQTQQERERIGVIGKRERVCSMLLAVIPDLLSVAAMLIFWTPWYMEVIQGVQGRYFLPTLPLLMIGVGFWKRPVIKVDTERPQATVIPIERHISEPSPVPTAIGIIPKTVVNVVINTGRRRDLPAVTTDVIIPMPRSRHKIV